MKTLPLFLGSILCLLAPLSLAQEITFFESLKEEWDDNARNWPNIQTGSSWESSISGSTLLWHNKSSSGHQSSRLKLPLSSRRPYELSLLARCLSPADESSYYGLLWGGNSANSSYQQFLLHADGSFEIIESFEDAKQTVSTGPLGAIYRQNRPNLIGVRKMGDETAYFVNGVCIEILPTPELFGPMCGPATGHGSKVAFDSFTIRYLRGEDEAFSQSLATYREAKGNPQKIFFDLPQEPTVDLAQPIIVEKKPADWDVIMGWFDEGFALNQEGKFEQATAKFRTVIAHAPVYADAHLQYAWSAMLLGDPATARQYADNAKLFEPLNLAAHAVDAYVLAFEGKEPEAIDALRLSFFLDPDDTNLHFFEKDMDDLIAAGVSPSTFATLKAKLPDLYQNRSRAFSPINRIAAEGFAKLNAGEIDAALAAFKNCRESLASLPSEYSWTSPHLLHGIGASLYRAGYTRDARPFLELALSAFSKQVRGDDAFQRCLLATELTDCYTRVGEAASGLELAKAELERAEQLPQLAASYRDELLLELLKSANVLDRADETRSFAERLLANARDSGNRWLEANAQNSLALSYAKSVFPNDRKSYRTHLENAFEIAQEAAFTDFARDLEANLAIAYYQSGEKDRAKKTYQRIIAQAIEENRPLDAELALNNLGSIYILEKDYAGAAPIFQQAVDLTEKYRDSFEGLERIRFLERRRGAYQFLAECQARAGLSDALFKTQNAIRARVLAENLNVDSDSAPQSLAAFQASLQPDEAALFYTLLGGAEVVVHVVTHEQARAVAVQRYDDFIRLKANYLDQMSLDREGYQPVGYTVTYDGKTYVDRNLANQISREDFDRILELGRGLIERSVQAPDELRDQAIHDILKAFHALLIQPVASQLSGKSKLLLFPDDALYFLPFEALPQADGRYLVQSFEVRYAQSAEVRRTLLERHYDSRRQDFLAMGGAVYHEMSETAEPARDATRRLQLQIEASSNALAGRPQREVYAALFSGAMNYLQGTLVEVATLSKIFPRATVFVGEDMTESRIKAMSRSGELANFKIVHLATHGFAIPDFPELSGIAMCIFPEMQHGEDGYLTAPEIAKLDMNADLAVLSACQTGLGRIYGGEGVEGLTSSLLVGGANSALVTLWPVNDAGTMRYMTGLYDLVVNQGLTYAAASAAMKRRFLSGEFGPSFQDIEIWAPFSLYGP